MKLGQVLAVVLLAGCMSVSAHADESFDVRLSPAPRDASMKPSIAGHGTARVTLRGNRLTIAGNFSAFPSPATRAALHRGPAVALRGPAIRELTVSSNTSGALTAELTLDAAELAALEAGQLYIQIDTAAAPDGNVWGWLLPANAPLLRDR
jgi:CHRD domain